MFVLIVTADAEMDIAEAAVWYEHQRTGLGKDFITELETGIQSVLQSPFRNTEQRFGYRREFIRRFPYGIIYRIENHKIVIVAVWHFSRKPWSWRKRKKK